MLRHGDRRWPPLPGGRPQHHRRLAISATNAQLPARYLRTPEAARFLGLSDRTLEKHRTYGTGPRYAKLDGRVVYRLEDLQAWVALGAKSSTSDPGVGTVLPAKRHAAISPAYAPQKQR